MIRSSLLGRSYPVVIPSSAPGRDGADGASVTGPAGPAGADGADGADGQDGAALLLNTVATPVALVNAGDHLFVDYTLDANAVKAGDILELEILASLPTTLTSELDFRFFVGNTTIISKNFQLRESVSGVSDGMPPIPPEGEADIKVLFKAKMLVKTLTTQFCTREYSFISASAEPVFKLGALSTSVNLGIANHFEGRVIIQGTGTVTIHYVSLTKYVI